MCCFIFAIVLLTPLSGYASPGEEQRIETHLQHVQTYYWLGIEERGNMRAFEQTRAYFNDAEQLLRQSELPDSTTRRLRRRIETLRRSIARQEELAHDTFYGVFPLARLLTRTIFADPTSTGTFELADEPAVRAVTNAAYELREAALEKWAFLPQINVIVRSDPRPPSLESEAFYIFNDSPQLYARSEAEVTSALSPPARDSLRRGLLSSHLIGRLCTAFEVPRILVVTVNRTDKVDDVHFYTLTGKIYEKGASAPSQVISETGFSRNRRGQQLPLLLGNLGFLLLGVLIYVLLAPEGHSSIEPSGLITPALAFAAGRALPWAAIPLLRTIIPLPETLAKLSFWWPLLVGVVLFAVLPALVWFLTIRFQLHPQGRAGAFLAVIMLGITAYFLTPLLLWAPLQGWLLAGLMTLALLPTAYVLGRVLDHLDQLPLAAGGLPLVVSIAAGAAMLHAHWQPVALLAGLSAVGCGVVLWLHDRSTATPEPARSRRTAQLSDSDPSSVDALIETAENPPYQRFDAFDTAKEKLSLFEEGRTAWLGLTGASGTGKTATAEALIADLCENNQAGYVLRGTCTEPLEQGERSAYNPFQEALKRHFKIGVLANPNLAAQHKRINEALDGLFDTFVPFASVLFPSAEASAEAVQSRDEIFRAIRDTLRKLSRERPTLLFIDDAQWIDADSEALLGYLLDTFPVESECSLAIVVNSRSPKTFTPVGMDDHVVSMGTPSRAQRRQILAKGLGFTTETADLIVEQVASGPDERGELFWLLEVVQYLGRHDHFESSSEGFTFSPSVDPTSLPLPNRLREVLEERLTAFPEYRHPLACAACLGETFRASALRYCLDTSRLNVLRLLKGIENDTGLIYDVQERDDEFSFRSTYLLEGVRQHFSISGAGPSATSVPQLVREYHARAAQALETIYQGTAEVPHGEIANHYFAAGQTFAEEGKEACLEAVRSAVDLFNFDQARTYVEKAKECAEALGEEANFQDEFLRVDCQEAHITGQDRKEVADRGLAYLADNTNVPLHLIKAVAQVCYDTARATKDQEYFEEAAHLGEILFERGTNPKDRAEGHHFLGLSLPPTEDTRDTREEHLRKALSLLDDASEENRSAQRLRGRIMNSLAELLSDEHSTEEEQREARQLYQQRITLNEELSLGDRKGLALTHGGLGRLMFYHRSNYQEARHHFEADLRFAQELNDREGQVQMHSLIGACALETGDLADAQTQYEQSLKLAENWISQVFALVGLVRVHARENAAKELNRRGQQLVDVTEWQALFPDLRSQVEMALDAAEENSASEDWYQTAREHLRRMNEGPN